MSFDVIKLYQKINEKHIQNRVDSLYWVFNVENRIIEEGNEKKNICMISIFNRLGNENDNLQKLYFHFNDEALVQESFQIDTRYNNPNIMYFVIERDIHETSSIVDIDAYIIDNKRVVLPRQYTSHIEFNDNTMIKDIIKDKYFKGQEDLCVTVPVIQHQYWICTCGYYNQTKDIICPKCGMKKTLISRLESIQANDLLVDINSLIEVNAHETLAVIIERAVNKYHERYHIPKKEILDAINISILKKRQEQFVDRTIHHYIHKHPVEYNLKMSFKDNILTYCQKITNQVITLEDVYNHLDLKQCKEDYLQTKTQNNQRKKQFKFVGFIILMLSIFIASIFILYYVLFNPAKEKKQEPVQPPLQQEISDDKTFKILQNTYTIKVNEEKQIEYQDINNDITFTSLDESVVIVDNLGKIKGISKGTAIIEVNDQKNNQKYTVQIKVEEVVSNNSAYIFSDSDTRLLTEDDVKNLSKEQLRIARNEIYARHNCSFKDETLMNYFKEHISSYDGTGESASDFSSLNEVETQNITFIRSHE